jgi:serine/threonine-protein kinase
MELLQGEVLADTIERDAPMAVDRARPVISQILQGLEVIHQAGVIHRDLKPGNVFLTDAGVVKIMDFGIARKVGLKSLTKTGSALGTPEFISPEQVLDTHQVDERTDLFNVGLMLYEMLTSTLPFRSDTLGEMLRRIVQGVAVPVTRWRHDLGDPLVRWMSHMLARNREDRYASAHDALDAIDW